MSFRKPHVAADLCRRLLLEIEADQDIALAFPHRGENSRRYIVELFSNDAVFGIGARIVHCGPEFDGAGLPSLLADCIYMSSHLAANDRSHIAHKPFRFAKLPAPNGLRNDHEQIVDFIRNVLRTELAAKVIANTIRENPV